MGTVVGSFKPVLEWSLTGKGRDLLIVDNNTFKSNKRTTTKPYWRCDEADFCKVWVQTTTNDVFIDMSKQEHNHFCDPDRVLVLKVIGNIRYRCKQELIAIAGIYEQEIKKAKFTQAQLSQMSRYDQIQSSLNHLRLSHLPPLPSNLDFVIPTKFTLNLDGDRFILLDLSNQKRFKRLIMFASERQVDVLFRSEWLFIDGTFKAASPMFTQLIYIIAPFKGEAITTCYALLDGQHTDGCRAVIGCLKNEAEKHGKALKAQFIMSDFENVLIKAITAEFPAGTRHVGYFFHHCQCLYRTTASLGLKIPYEKDDVVRETCRKLMAVAFMPIDDIEDAYLELLKCVTPTTFRHTNIFELMKDLMKYSDQEWLNIVVKEMFCVTKLDWGTNNLCEGIY